jgi:hypothetical protein
MHHAEMRRVSGKAKAGRAAIFVVCMLFGLIATLAGTGVFLGVNGTGRVTANPDARILMALGAIVPAGVLAFLVIEAKAGRWPAQIGILAGLLVGSGAYLALSIEEINAATAGAGRQIVAPIVEVRTAGRSGNEFYIVRVVIDDELTDLFWGRDFPNGWNVQGRCLHARTDIGRLGIRWIGERSIGRCNRSAN